MLNYTRKKKTLRGFMDHLTDRVFPNSYLAPTTHLSGTIHPPCWDLFVINDLKELRTFVSHRFWTICPTRPVYSRVLTDL